MQTLKTIKPGDTFAFYANIEDDAGTPLAGLADTMKCQIRNSIDELIADVGITETQIPGQYLFEVQDTTLWPVGVLYTDIRFANGDRVKLTETLKIKIVKEVTKDG